MFNTPKKGHKVLVLFLIIAISLGLFLLGANSGKKATENRLMSAVIGIEEGEEYLIENVDFDLFWEIWNLTKSKYYKQPVRDTELFYGALEGMVSGVGDPYTVFFKPDLTKDFVNSIQGTFEGVGMEIAIKNDFLISVSPLSGSPAEKAGMRPKDIIIKIDDLETFDMSVHEAVMHIRGDKGTTVVLTVVREGVGEPFEVPIVRGQIQVDSLTWKMLENNIAYIDLVNFNGETNTLMNKAINEIIVQQPNGVILDLRNNPGGYLESAIDIASKWVTRDEVVVIERKSNQQQFVYRSEEKPLLSPFKTVILINEGSASASEIVAGALRDYDLATLIGKKTFGKGSVQEYIPLKDGSSVKITVAEWLTPDGDEINEKGIEPDIEIDLTIEDFNASIDPQLDRAIEYLLKE